MANSRAKEDEKSDSEPPGHSELTAQEVKKLINQALEKFKTEIISQITIEMAQLLCSIMMSAKLSHHETMGALMEKFTPSSTDDG
ncbi:hypothetical protein H920_17479 [Fukomys damarensis]|uniref:Uncharacterized protein n=1 Tax=Fukomys damarensis TaxID=885580 RepID=A0A091DEB5_FUKDA|nr:hypothetical protein H920_17479 [Fukomys damarensis]